MSAEISHLEEMRDWVDFDVALFAIGRALGMLSGEFSELQNAKILFWSQTPIHDHLLNIAEELIRIGYLEYSKERRQYRLRQDFSVCGSIPDSGAKPGTSDLDT